MSARTPLLTVNEHSSDQVRLTPLLADDDVNKN
uniref:Uncharacterized protein n=1 Tax=Anguilla anguilla TaxID=7936 RepID=A0A0E9T456_ANGAN